MSEALYERYKDALRRGHAASLRGRFDEAIAAYAEAASIAPDRAMPQASLAGVLARTGRHHRGPRRLRRGARPALPRTRRRCAAGPRCSRSPGRRADAAETLDRLAAVLDRDGRLLEASDAARRALELAESRGRREGVEALVAAACGRPASTRRPRPSAGRSAPLEGAVPRRVRREPKRDPRRSVMSAAAVLTAAAETALDAGRPRRGPSLLPRGRRRPALDRQPPRGDGRVLPGPGRLAGGRRRPPEPHRALPRPRLACARPPTSWCCSAGSPSSPATTSPVPGCARWRPTASPTTRDWRPSAADR